MEEVKAINKEHGVICNNMIKFVEKQTYRATEEFDLDKYADYQPIKEAIIITYNNAFDHINTGSFTTDEVVYMLPNLLLFSFAGFLAGLVKEENKVFLQKLNDETAAEYAIYTDQLTDLLDEICLKQK